MQDKYEESLESLWLEPTLGDDIAEVHHHKIIVGKPKDFYWTVPDKAYRRRAEIYTHKVEGAIEEQHFIIAKSMRGKIDEARPCTLVTVVYRDGTPRLWPIKSPRNDERDNNAWISARAAAKAGMAKWTKLVWARGAYLTRDAAPGYAPEPNFTKPPFKLPPFEELIKLGFGEHGIINDFSHPVYRELFGAALQSTVDDDDAGDL